MTMYRVISPILHDQNPYAIGTVIDGSILSEGQAEALIEAKALEVIEDTPAEAAPEPTVAEESAEPAPAEALPAAEPVSAPQADPEPAAAEPAAEQETAPATEETEPEA